MALFWIVINYGFSDYQKPMPNRRSTVGQGSTSAQINKGINFMHSL